MTAVARPAHVPDDLVRPFSLDFRGPLDELFPRLDALRDEGRVVWVPVGGGLGGVRGAWLLTHAEDIRHALQHPELFSSALGGGTGGIPEMIPLLLDPPDHTAYRRLLNPLFSPGVVAAMEDGIRSRIHDLVAELAPRGRCDFVADVAVQFPTRVFTAWVGLPEEDTGRFVAMVSALIHGTDDDGARRAALGDMLVVLDGLVAERMAAPADDLVSRIAALELDGRRLDHDELMRITFLLFLAGLDTVAAALSFAFAHLAQVPADRAAIASGAVPVAQAVEELLRRHSFINLPRAVARDVEFAGVSLRAGDPVLIPLALASRDPAEYPRAEDVELTRDGPRHYAFGLGPHRCIGSHLARLEMRVALDEWHTRIPDYRLAGEASAYAGTVMGLTSLPLAW